MMHRNNQPQTLAETLHAAASAARMRWLQVLLPAAAIILVLVVLISGQSGAGVGFA